MCIFTTPAPSNPWATAGSAGVLLPDLLQGPLRPHSGPVAFCIPWHMIQGSVLMGGMCYSRTLRCLLVLRMLPWGSPGRSAGKESIYNVRDTRSIPGSGRSPGEGIVYPLQYCWASLVAQTAKNLPAMWETWVQSLGQEDPLEEGMATLFNIAWRIPMGRGAWLPGSCKNSDTTKQLSTAQHASLW